MTTYYEIREASQRRKIVGKANTLLGAQRAKLILEEKTGVKLLVYGPAHQTRQQALEALR